MKKQHIVKTPCTLEQGGFTFRYGWTKNKQEALKEALHDYNSARAHDGQEALLRLPRGTTIEIKREAI